MKSGEKLKQDLGLGKFKYILIHKILSLPINVYVITINSRFPGIYIPFKRAKYLKSAYLKKLKKHLGLMQTANYTAKDMVTTPPIPLTSFDRPINNNDVVMVRDMAGEFYRNPKMFAESIKIGRVGNLKKYKEVFNDGKV